MKTTFLHRALALLVAAVLPLLAFAASDSPSLLLEKGIYAEEIERNLDSAIKIYEQIAAEAAANRAVVAQAQYRLAVCYQKQGKKEQAVKIFTTLLEQLPSDAATTQKAREALMALGQKPGKPIEIRKVIVPDARYVWPGMDGRYIGFAPPKPRQSDLMLYDTITGKSWTVEPGTDDTGTWAGPQISPDREWIAYDRSEQTKIRLAKIDGSATRTVIEREGGKDHGYLHVAGWSRDSGRIYVIYSTRKEKVLLSVDAKTGTDRELFRAPAHDRDWWNVSSDGRYLARCNGENPRTISIITLESGREETVVDKDANRVFEWVAEDSAIVYTKNGKRGTELWAMGIKDGKAASEPQLIWNNFTNESEVLPRGISKNGEIFYNIRRGESAGDWVMDGFLPQALSTLKSPAFRPEIPIPLTDLIGSNNTVVDRKANVSFTLPSNWSLRAANLRGNGATHIAMNPVARIAGASLVTIAYRSMSPWDDSVFSVFPLKDLAPQPTSPAEIDPWLRSFARAMERQRIERNMPGSKYKNRADSLTFRTINESRALSWVADYTTEEQARTESFTVIFGKTVIAWIWFQTATAKIDEVRPALTQLIDSVRLP